MKRSIAIGLLFVFLFNVGGYYIFFWGLRLSADKELTQRLDAESYHVDETIELKIPVNLPYPLQETGFERANGKFEHEGQFYKFVKQKLENDTIYVICIRDIDQRAISTSLKNYSEKTSDLPASSKNTLQQLSKVVDLKTSESSSIQSISGWCQQILRPEMTFSTHEPIRSLASPPPKV